MMSEFNKNPTACSAFDQEWNLILDGDARELSALSKDHLESCDRCQSIQKGFAILSRLPEYQSTPRPPKRVTSAFVMTRLQRDRWIRVQRMTFGAFAVAAALAIAVYLRERPARNNDVSIKPPNTKAEDLKSALKQWETIGNDVATATLRAAETPLEIPSKLLKIKSFRASDAIPSWQPISVAFTSMGESTKESFEPLRKSAEYTVKQWWKSVSEQTN
ncbi:hypothetical protein KIH39_03825 [Telmatocola sphagniphila]|uniref:Zinc-finger domain-containing protein n=1 Tax=Telmatocola sphagniphila TaxID=1123043 RepID=A0A8E6EZ47_9BACT|nr:hypothetical protein [Telmatocola sphagniphila]QVL33056.1 hypothetical protein KIH39_03825 [Telmatocola sphagniphila]